MKKRNNFIIEFAKYKEFVKEAKQDKNIKPLLSFDNSKNLFASLVFSIGDTNQAHSTRIKMIVDK